MSYDLIILSKLPEIPGVALHDLIALGNTVTPADKPEALEVEKEGVVFHNVAAGKLIGDKGNEAP